MNIDGQGIISSPSRKGLIMTNEELQAKLEIAEKKLEVYNEVLKSWCVDSAGLDYKYSRLYDEADSKGKRKLKEKRDYYSAQNQTVEFITHEIFEGLRNID